MQFPISDALWNVFSLKDFLKLASFLAGSIFTAYKLVSNHMSHLEERLTKRLDAIEAKIDDHVKWHMDHQG